MHVVVEYQLWSQKRMPKISGWLVLKNGWANLFHLWVVDSAQNVLGL